MCVMDDLNGFGERLRAAMERAGYSKSRRAAAALDVADGQLRNWLLDRSRPRLEYVPVICRTFNVSANELLGLDQDPNPTT